MSYLPWIAPPVLILAGFLWFGLPFLLRRRGQGRLQRLCADRRAICLTFDDGPGSQLTRDLLALLDSRDAKATFFMLGRQAEALPEIADEVRAAGHEVGSHSYAHRNAWKTLPWVVAKDIRKGQDAVERLVGQCQRFRPPYGKTTLMSLLQTKLIGCSIGWWTHDSGDTWPSMPGVESVLENLRSSGGGVVLLHDFDRQRPPERVQYVLDLTRAILDLAAEQSMTVIPMSDLGEWDRD